MEPQRACGHNGALWGRNKFEAEFSGLAYNTMETAEACRARNYRVVLPTCSAVVVRKIKVPSGTNVDLQVCLIQKFDYELANRTPVRPRYLKVTFVNVLLFLAVLYYTSGRGPARIVDKPILH